MKIISNYKKISSKILWDKLFHKRRNIVFLMLLLNGFSLLTLYLLRNNYMRVKKELYELTQLEVKDVVIYLKELTTAYDWEKKIKRLDLNLSYKNTLLLDCLRSKKSSYLRNSFDVNNELCSGKKWGKGTLVSNGINYPIKLKAKGDRASMHRIDFKSMSFKVDIRGEKRYMGMEEFSIQSPIIRNYTSELLASKLMSDIGISSPRQHYVRLFINGEYVGLRHVEESFSRELIESSKKRYGPVFSLQEEISIDFGKTRFDLSDLEQWNAKNKPLASEALTILEVSQREPALIKKFFDLELWAKYFALSDILYTYHGAIPKSVKFYLNPTTGLFEPAFFDGHQPGNENFKDFLLIDFTKINADDTNCNWICNQKFWFNSFFMDGDKIDEEFYITYKKSLKKYSSEDYELKNIKFLNKELRPLRGALYREFARRDDIWNKGFMPHIKKESLLDKRLKEIRMRINIAENDVPYFSINNDENILSITNQSSELPQVLSLFCGQEKSKPIILRKQVPVLVNFNIFKTCAFEDLNYSINETGNTKQVSSNITGNLDFEIEILSSYPQVKIDKDKANLILEKKEFLVNQNLDWNDKNIVVKNDIKICLANSSILSINNSKIINIENKKITFIGCGVYPGSVIISNSDINLNEIEIFGLSFPQKNLTTLYGGLNVIKSNLRAEKLFINSSLSEDGVNFINSDIKLDLIKATNIQSDAIDSDASNLIIGEINCKKVKNDCLDLSYSSAKVYNLKAEKVGDKVISAGESSIINLDNVIAFDSEMGIVAKDSSKIFVQSFEAESVVLPIAAYIKKPELGSPLIQVSNIEEKLLQNNLISKDSFVSLSGKKIYGILESKQISEMLYGNLYGVRTIR